MTVLEVEYIYKIFDRDSLVVLVETGSWCVTEPAVVLHGFVRRKDAEIARKFLEELDLDYSLCSDAFWEQFSKYGLHNKEAVMKKACERLQW
jgi:hypothetical protein